MSDPRGETGFPGGPSYDNFNYYQGAPGFFPNPGWGGPSSPAYQTHMAAPRDYMRREDQYAGNQAFAPPGGISLGGPLTSMMANIMLPMVLGGSAQSVMAGVKPFSSPDMPPLDYMMAKMRSAQAFGMRDSLYGLDSKYRESAFGNLGKGMMASAIFDQINPAGSREAAFQSIYGRMGTSFGGTQAQQANQSFETIKAMNEAFSIKTGANAGLRNWNASHGASDTDMIDQFDSGSRYGIAGMSKGRFASATPGARAQMMGDSSRLFAAAGNVFGKDKTSDELANLMSKTIDGIGGMDANKATELLNKIQAASRAVDISSKAWAEYKGMFDDLSRSMGVQGGASAGEVSNMVMNARVATQHGSLTGNAALTDQSRNMTAEARSQANFLGSPTANKLMALQTSLNAMTDSQLSAVKLPDGRTGLDFKKGMKGLVEGGDQGKWNEAIKMAESGQLGIDREGYWANAMNPSEEVRRDASKVADYSEGQKKAASAAFRGHVASMLNSKMSAGQRGAIGGAEGMDNLLKTLDLADLKDPNKIMQAMASMGIEGSSKDYEDIAGKIAGAGIRGKTMSALGQATFGPGEDSDFNWNKDQRDTGGLKDQTRHNERLQALLGEMSGDALRGVSGKDLIGAGIDVLKQIHQGTLPGVKEDDVLTDGELDLGKLMKVAPAAAMGAIKSYAESVTGSKAMKKLGAVMDPKNMDSLNKQGDLIYDKAIREGKTPDEAQAMSIEAMRQLGKEASQDINGEDGPEPIQRLPVERSAGDTSGGGGGGGESTGGISGGAEKAIVNIYNLLADYLKNNDPRNTPAPDAPGRR